MVGDSDLSFYRTTLSSAPVVLALYTQEVHEQNGRSTGTRRLSSCMHVVGRWEQRCHYMTRVAGREDPHPTCTTLILTLHGPPSRYTFTYTCRR
jgi:hypothetical protein